MDEETKKLSEDARSRKVKDLNHNEEGILKFGDKLYVPNIEELS